NLRTLRHIIRIQDEAFYEGKDGQSLRRKLIELDMVPEKYQAPPGASIKRRMDLIKKYRSKINPEVLAEHRKEIRRVIESIGKRHRRPRLPAKTPDGFRDLAIRAMVRLLRRHGHQIAYDTVEKYLERYRQVKPRLAADTADYKPDV